MAIVIIETADLELLIQKVIDRALVKQSLSLVAEPGQEVLILAPQAAQLLNVSLSTLHSYKKQGIIPFHRIGRRVYFRESEILLSLKKIN